MTDRVWGGAEQGVLAYLVGLGFPISTPPNIYNVERLFHMTMYWTTTRCELMRDTWRTIKEKSVLHMCLSVDHDYNRGFDAYNLTSFVALRL